MMIHRSPSNEIRGKVPHCSATLSTQTILCEPQMSQERKGKKEEERKSRPQGYTKLPLSVTLKMLALPSTGLFKSRRSSVSLCIWET